MKIWVPHGSGISARAVRREQELTNGLGDIQSFHPISICVHALAANRQNHNCKQESECMGDVACAKMVSMSSKTRFVRSDRDTQALDADAAWRQLVRRDAAAEFFYGVTTTGVFCRPGCSSRLPLRRNVRFFRTVAEAQAAGFRACRRCSPDADPARGGALKKIRAHVETHADRRVSLDELGRVAGLSPFTVQRLFKRAMGVSPLQYQRALRAGGRRWSGLRRSSPLRWKSWRSWSNCGCWRTA